MKKQNSACDRCDDSLSTSHAAASMLQQLPLKRNGQASVWRRKNQRVFPSFSMSSSPSMYNDGHQSDTLAGGSSWDSKEESIGTSEEDDEGAKSAFVVNTRTRGQTDQETGLPSFSQSTPPLSVSHDYLPSNITKERCLLALQPLVDEVNQRDYFSLFKRILDHCSESAPFPRTTPETTAFVASVDNIEIPTGDSLMHFVFWVLVGELFCKQRIEVLDSRIIAPTLSKHRLAQHQQHQLQQYRSFHPIGVSSSASSLGTDSTAASSFHALFSPLITPSAIRSSPLSYLGKRTFSSITDPSLQADPLENVTVEYLLKVHTHDATSSVTSAAHLWRTFHTLIQHPDQHLDHLRNICARGTTVGASDDAVREVVDMLVENCRQLLKGNEPIDTNHSSSSCQLRSQFATNPTSVQPSVQDEAHQSLLNGSLHHSLPALFAEAQEQQELQQQQTNQLILQQQTVSTVDLQDASAGSLPVQVSNAACVLLEGHIHWGISHNDYPLKRLQVQQCQWRILAESSSS